MGEGTGELADWYSELYTTKRVAAYLGCSYLELDASPLRDYYIEYASAAMAAEADAERITRELAIKP